MLPQPSDKNKNVARMGRPGLLLQCAEGGDACAQEGGFVVGGQDFKREALQRGHLDHGFQVGAERGELDPVGVVAGEVEAAGSGEVDEGSGGGGESAMPEVDEVAAL